MPTTITINLKNMSNSNQNFFFFQAPATYVGGPTVYSNSLFGQILLPYSTSGAVLSFSLTLQFYAGVQQQIAVPVVGTPSGQLAASQAIGLTPAPGGTPTNNTTAMTVAPSLGLSPATATTGPQAGAFRIVTPSFDTNLVNYNAGSAMYTTAGGITLSNFVTAQPLNNIDCQPVLNFYVQTGSYTAGTVMNFTQSSAGAALCDATSGFTTFDVQYKSDGTWSVTPHVSTTRYRVVDTAYTAGDDGLIGGTANAEIRNEAGSSVLAVGQADNFNSPVTIRNLNPANAVQQLSEYQVGPINGPYTGLMCIDRNGNGTEATFS